MSESQEPKPLIKRRRLSRYFQSPTETTALDRRKVEELKRRSVNSLNRLEVNHEIGAALQGRVDPLLEISDYGDIKTADEVDRP